MTGTDKDSAKLPRPLAALMGLAGLIAAAIAIAAGPGWVIGGFGGAVVVILIAPLRRSVLRWPASTGRCAIAGAIVVLGGLAGWLIGSSGGGRPAEKTLRSPKADIPATGYKDGKWFEQEGTRSVEVFGTPGSRSTVIKPTIEPFQIVQVTCRIHASGITTAEPEGNWYRIASRPWNNRGYAAANAFWNGSNVEKGPGIRNTDLHVPTCESQH